MARCANIFRISTRQFRSRPPFQELHQPLREDESAIWTERPIGTRQYVKLKDASPRPFLLLGELLFHAWCQLPPRMRVLQKSGTGLEPDPCEPGSEAAINTLRQGVS